MVDGEMRARSARRLRDMIVEVECLQARHTRTAAGARRARYASRFLCYRLPF